MRKSLLLVLSVAFILAVAACGKEAATVDIGISMPTTSSSRWISDGY